ncbi:MAG: hypothetical protein ABI898_04270 [Sphingomonadales bacterium]
MKILPLAAVLAATFALAACDKKPAEPVVNTDPNSANFTGAATPVVLPPAVKSSKLYRCDDGSVVKVGLFQGDKMANVAEENGPPTMLHASEAGKPLVAEGFELMIAGEKLTLTRPGHPKQTCDG